MRCGVVCGLGFCWLGENGGGVLVVGVWGCVLGLLVVR